MKEKATIGFLTSLDPKDKRAWSGTQFRMLTALEKEFEEVVVLGPIPRPRITAGIIARIDKFTQLILKKKYNREQNILKSIYYYTFVKKKIKNANIDLIFSSSAGPEIAFIQTKTPICYLADASFDQLLGYYPNYSKFASFSIRESRFVMKKAINNSHSYVFPSEWATDFAIKKYNLKKENAHVVKFGANMDYVPDVARILNKSYDSEIQMLFLGRDWERKGGDIAFDTLKRLVEKGLNIKLTVCGCVPPVQHANMKVIPFLNKNSDKEMAQFHELLYQSHLLFVPTRSECYGIVFCEAAAFGIPVITTDTGGVSTIVKNGVNGYALPYNATSLEYANQIEKLLADKNSIKQLVKNSLEKFKKELNWNVWGKEMRAIMAETIRKNKK
ncbi:glycosyltransferase family 4 protein [Polaribacter sp. Q13]|uniref:glycosyltransferase family 4 protein n=1 Tax=Polaribacter sp. Q13 TaxID=2806551 RepID=UPI00193BD4E2|nr:glycosyltransferase family 4 protein [Polaribacter sp. Q13]QVY65787.1 glycosyltransferase family 4 protein [Polaribacter sp. Q13]